MQKYNLEGDTLFFFLPSIRYFALGLLYHYNGQDSAALQVCKLKVTLTGCQRRISTRNLTYPLCSPDRCGSVWWMASYRTPQDQTFMSTLWTSCAPVLILISYGSMQTGPCRRIPLQVTKRLNYLQSGTVLSGKDYQCLST